MSDQSDIRVLIADDHMVVRKGLSQVLEEQPHIEIVGEAEDGEEALYLAKKLKPDVILMDIRMPGIGGAAATRLIKQQNSDLKIVVFSSFVQTQSIKAMREAGASSFVLKDVSADRLAETIRRAFLREEGDWPAISEPEVSTADNKILEAMMREMGAQQRKVLALITKGLTNNEIADMMGISMPTARYHVSAILKKLDVSNRSEAAALAIRNKLISYADFD